MSENINQSDESSRYIVSITAIADMAACEEILPFLSGRAGLKAPRTVEGLMAGLPLVLTSQADMDKAQWLKQELESLSAEVAVDSLADYATPGSLREMSVLMQAEPLTKPVQVEKTPSLPPGAYCSKHPEKPAGAVCMRCGDFICDTCDVGPEGQNYCENCLPIVFKQWQRNRKGLPWDMRKQIGFFRSIYRTIRLLLFRPTEFFGKMNLTGGYRSPLWYAVAIALCVVPLNLITLWLTKPALEGMSFTFPFYNGVIRWAYDSGLLVLEATVGTAIMLGINSVVYYIGAYILGARMRLETVFRITAFVSGSLAIFSFILYPLEQMFEVNFYIFPLIVSGGLILLAMHITYMYFGFKIVLQLPKGKAILASFSIFAFTVFLVILFAIIFVIIPESNIFF